MFHIVFDTRGAELLNAAMDLDPTLDGETVVFGDDYSVGPIADLFSESGVSERTKWWTAIQSDAGIASQAESDQALLQKILTRMEEEEFDQIWIWMAPNARDLSGYYWLITQLSAFAGRVFVISLNNLPFINEKGHVFYPAGLAEIPAREYVKAKKLVRPVTPAEFETDPDEWNRLASENKHLRFLEGGKKIVQQPDNYADKALQNYLQPAFQKVTRTVHQFLAKSPDKINEAFLTWRLKMLVESGIAEQQGESVRIFAKEGDKQEA